jgi:hypothetical protein
MPEALFRAPFYPVWQQTLQKAFDDVNALDRRAFSDPSLSGRLQAIADKYSLTVARLQKEGVEGRARQQERRVRDAWGDPQSITQGWLDVTIPFTGDADSLRICPSRSTILQHAAEIGAQHIVINLPDDDRADGAVQAFITQANQNLDALRADYEQAKPQLEQAIQRAADQRRTQVTAEGERDKRLSFPVRR